LLSADVLCCLRVSRWKAGDKYTGEWKHSLMHGKGTYHYRNGRKYEGDWVAGYKQGIGTFTWPNGDSYKGQFHLDKCNGMAEGGVPSLADEPLLRCHRVVIPLRCSLSMCMCLSLSLSLSMCLCLCLSLCVCVCVCLSVSVSVSLCLCLSMEFSRHLLVFTICELHYVVLMCTYSNLYPYNVCVCVIFHSLNYFSCRHWSANLFRWSVVHRRVVE
jgi:MORN repeat